MAGNKQPFYKSRAFRQGSLASTITVLFIAVVVALNLFVGALAERNQWRLDLTAQQIFVLSHESRDFLAEFDTNVTIYVLTGEANLTAAGIYFIQANEVIRQYAALSPHITVRYVDLTREPAFAARFPQFQLNTQTILLVTQDRVETLSIFDLFNIESDMLGREHITSSRAEQILTSMLMFLSMDRYVTVGVLTGFGDADSSGLISLLEANRYNIVTLNLLTEEIDPEVTMLVLNAPTRDYTEGAIARLEQFLQGERDVSLLYFAGTNQPPLPNIEAFLADWGIVVLDGVVYQTDLNMRWDGPFVSRVQYTETIYSRHALDFFSVMPHARPLDFIFHQRGTRTVSAPMIFNHTAFVQPLDMDDDLAAQTPLFGPFAALAMSYDQIMLGDGTERTSVVAVFASQHFIGPSMLLHPNIGNAQYMLGLVETLTDHMGGVAIAPKVIGASPLPVTDFETILFGALFVIALPLAVIFAGGVVFLRRRHL